MPRPPSLHLPATVKDLSGERIGDRIELHWTAPTRTTDGLELTPEKVTKVEVCRDSKAPGIPAPKPKPASPPLPGVPVPPIACTPVLHPSGQPGANAAVDQLPATLTDATGTRTLLAYRVRTLNAGGHSADPSSPVLIPTGPAVAAVEDFHAVQTSQGVVLDWSGQNNARGTVEVLRTLVSTASPATQPTAPVTASKPKGKKSPPVPGSKPAHQGKAKNTDKAGEVRLRQEEADAAQTPPAGNRDGMIDESALLDQTYTYTAQRVETIHLSSQTIEVRSEPTPAVTIIRRDTFPPEVPTGLASVHGVLHEAGTARPTIDLSWKPNVETDLAGYNIYRTQPDTNVTRQKLNAAPLAGPAYRDTTAIPGVRYRYEVTAIDQTGNESKFSTSAEDSADAP
ncbi:Large repetitive protein [Granulicella sibirica]|uniref:Large repetitive protein n=1 Tax=Granulicella sibirica TaxID=2479048 RepID=A0A4Q0T986_9BACT|nr:Large repetitive protein [Granulicella sibirica]